MSSKPRRTVARPRPQINRRFPRPGYRPPSVSAPPRRVFARRLDRPAFQRRLPKAFNSFLSLGLTTGLVVILGLTILIFEAVYGDRVTPHVAVDGIALGGVSLSDAEGYLLRKEGERNGQPILLRVASATYPVTRAQFSASYQYRQALRQALAVGHDSDFVTRLWNQLSTMIEGKEYQIAGRHDTRAVRDYLARLDARITIQPKPAMVGMANGQVQILREPVAGRRLDRPTAEQLLNQALRSRSQSSLTLPIQVTGSPISHDLAQATVDQAQQLLSQRIYFSALNHIKGFELPPSQLVKLLTFTNTYDQNKGKWLVAMGIDRRKLQATLAPITARVNKAPTPAYYRLVEGTNGGTDYAVAEEGSPGTVVDIDATGPLILAAAYSHQVTVPLISPRSTFDQRAARKLHFDAEIARIAAGWGGSDKERVVNIAAAATWLNGIRLLPGQTLSVTTAISPATGLKGFVKGLNTVAPTDLSGANGGATALASALFQAAYAAGLPVIARTPYPYLNHLDGPIGYDALVVARPQGPDLQIVNDTKHQVLFLIKTYQGRQSATVYIFSSSDIKQRTVQVDAPQLTINPDGSVDTLIARRLSGGGGPDAEDRFGSHYEQLDPYP